MTKLSSLRFCQQAKRDFLLNVSEIDSRVSKLSNGIPHVKFYCTVD